MAVAVHSQDYLAVAQERASQASELRRAGHHGLAMYVAGVAAESMLRAYHRRDTDLDERHDISQLFKHADAERLGQHARKRLRSAVQTVHLLWQNRYRFFSEERLRAHIKALGQDRRGVARGADFLQVRCVELEDACLTIVTVGVERWK